MKLSINKRILADLPAPISQFVDEWRTARRARFMSVEHATHLTIDEGGSYTAFSADCSRTGSARADGEWAGPSGLPPMARLEIPVGCTVIETGWLLGKPHLTIYHNSALGHDGAVQVTGAKLPELSHANLRTNHPLQLDAARRGYAMAVSAGNTVDAKKQQSRISALSRKMRASPNFCPLT